MRTARTQQGWRIAWSLAVTQTVGFGVLFYAYAVFTLPMEAELGWTRAQTSGAYSLALLVAGLAALPAGRWVDRHGARGLASAGSIAGATLVLAWSFVSTLPALYLVQAGIGLAMATMLYDVAFTVIAAWFRRDRIRALLIVTTVAGLASTIFVPAATILVEGPGWRPALRVLAALLLAVTLPLHALVLRRSPADVGTAPDGGAPEAPEPSVAAPAALRTRGFWWMAGAFGLNRAIIVAVAAHAVPLLLERGHPPGVVAAAAGSIGLMQVAGRLLFAPASRRLALSRLASATYALHAVALVTLAWLPGPPGLWAFASLFGLANGASTLARAGLVAEAFGPAHYGAINGSITTLITGPQALAPVAVGALHVASGGYGPALATLVIASLAASLLVTRGADHAPTATAA